VKQGGEHEEILITDKCNVERPSMFQAFQKADKEIGTAETAAEYNNPLPCGTFNRFFVAQV